ncbi:MAG: hypothetical protein EP145_20585 [Bacteroides uniformis]|nr:hypothetical protein [Bacteroides uniformis]
MNQAFATSAPPAPMRMPMPVTRRKGRWNPNLPSSSRHGDDRTGTHFHPVEPILEISRHPDRNRLLAKLFSEE